AWGGPGAAAPEAVAAPAVQPISAGVLLVEDNTVNQQVALGMLRVLGCRVEIAGNGREALDRLARERYDIIFMDCQMPEMDGYVATAELRRREGTSSRTPVVAMTAGAMEGDRETCLAAGMDDYVTKPLEMATIGSVLRRWVPVSEGTPPPEPIAAEDVPPESPEIAMLDVERLAVLRATLGRNGSDAILAGVFGAFLADTKDR